MSMLDNPHLTRVFIKMCANEKQSTYHSQQIHKHLLRHLSHYSSYLQTNDIARLFRLLCIHFRDDIREKISIDEQLKFAYFL